MATTTTPETIRIIRSNERHVGNFGWLMARWHFSFGDYHDPANVRWGALRVFNDDVVQGGGGFEPHPHRDMEIITYVLEGALEHQDNLGNRGVIHPGEVQVMSAGSGITHAEFNHSKTQPVHLLQIWIFPRNKGNTPRWEQKQFTPEARRGKLLPVVSSGHVEGTLAIDQDATVYVSSLTTGERVAHETREDRKLYLFVISGGVTLNGQALNAGDQARIQETTRLEISAQQESELILLDLPETR